MFSWLKELDGKERKTLIAAVGGWATDSVDVMVFVYVIPTLMAVWSMTKVQAGWITTATVISSAIGGWLAGVLDGLHRPCFFLLSPQHRPESITARWVSSCPG